MAWQAPKTNWTAEDGVRDADMNRIEGNILELYNKASLDADKLVYVNGSSGNDTTGDGTSSKPFATIGKAIDSLPRATGKYNTTINIAGGTYNENVVIAGVAGAVRLTGSSGSVVTISSLRVSAAICLVNNITLAMSGASIGLRVEDGATFSAVGNVRVSNATSQAVLVEEGSVCSIGGYLDATNVGTGLEARTAGRAYIGTFDGEQITDGLKALTGGIIQYNNNTATVTGVIHTASGGGRIYKGAQQSVPNY